MNDNGTPKEEERTAEFNNYVVESGYNQPGSTLTTNTASLAEERRKRNSPSYKSMYEDMKKRYEREKALNRLHVAYGFAGAAIMFAVFVLIVEFAGR